MRELSLRAPSAQQVIKLATILDCLGCNLRPSLGFLGFFLFRLHLYKSFIKLLVHGGELGVDLLKPLVQYRQRVQHFLSVVQPVALIFMFLPDSRLQPASVLTLAPPVVCSVL